MKPYLSIIIPAYNEETRIVKSLAKAIEYFENNQFDFEIVVVDDGSVDRTVDVLEDFHEKVRVISLAGNMGKGAAVRKGMLEATGEIRLFSDADFSTPVYEVKKLLIKIEEGADICIGSRALDRSMVKEHQPFYRELMGKTYNRFVQALVFKGITDTQCGFKAFTEDAVYRIFPNARISGFSFDVEILYLAKKEGLKVEQVPVEWYNDERSTVNPITDATMMFVELFRIRKLHK
ncbi:dolichyl-phosphate beta-glucosyltransferase [Bacteroidota bacterium]